MNILITGACGVAPRAIARSLRMSRIFGGATLIGTDRGGNWYGFYEGLYQRVYRVPEPRDPSYASTIAEICEREAIDVAMVVPEAEVVYWSRRDFPVPTLLPSGSFADVAISKRNLYDALRQTDLIPKYSVVTRDDLVARRGLELVAAEVWLRAYADASSSGAGAIKVAEPEQAYAWAYLNPSIGSFMASEHLPGRNLACCMLFVDDALLKVACYERVEYFIGHLVMSGVTGHISRGRLVNDERTRAVSEEAVRIIAKQLGERAHGLLTVDLREDADGAPKVTEINIRHVAGTSALAAGGANMSEAQVLASLGRLDEIGEVVPTFADDNAILRDIDGEPLWISPFEVPEVGQAVSRR